MAVDVMRIPGHVAVRQGQLYHVADSCSDKGTWCSAVERPLFVLVLIRHLGKGGDGLQGHPEKHGMLARDDWWDVGGRC